MHLRLYYGGLKLTDMNDTLYRVNKCSAKNYEKETSGFWRCRAHLFLIISL